MTGSTVPQTATAAAAANRKAALTATTQPPPPLPSAPYTPATCIWTAGVQEASWKAGALTTVAAVAALPLQPPPRTLAYRSACRVTLPLIFALIRAAPGAGEEALHRCGERGELPFPPPASTTTPACGGGGVARRRRAVTIIIRAPKTVWEVSLAAAGGGMVVGAGNGTYGRLGPEVEYTAQ